jgi:hypothetical protein
LSSSPRQSLGFTHVWGNYFERLHPVSARLAHPSILQSEQITRGVGGNDTACELPMTVIDLITTIFNGLSFSSILILTALGLAITFGVMRVINMAHGDMLILGAYSGYLVTDPAALPRVVRSAGVVLRISGRVLGTAVSQT